MNNKFINAAVDCWISSGMTQQKNVITESMIMKWSDSINDKSWLLLNTGNWVAHIIFTPSSLVLETGCRICTVQGNDVLDITAEIAEKLKKEFERLLEVQIEYKILPSMDIAFRIKNKP